MYNAIVVRISSFYTFTELMHLFMSYQGTLHRWLLLMQKIGGGRHPSFEEIRSFLHNRIQKH